LHAHYHLETTKGSSQISISALQESKEVLERLQRMDAFESQDFDTVVRCTAATCDINRGS